MCAAARQGSPAPLRVRMEGITYINPSPTAGYPPKSNSDLAIDDGGGGAAGQAAPLEFQKGLGQPSPKEAGGIGPSPIARFGCESQLPLRRWDPIRFVDNPHFSGEDSGSF